MAVAVELLDDVRLFDYWEKSCPTDGDTERTGDDGATVHTTGVCGTKYFRSQYRVFIYDR